MKELTAEQLYSKLKYGEIKYNEDFHCKMILEVIPRDWRVSAFLKEAMIGERTFYRWVHKHPIFEVCYYVAQVLAQENWEKEEIKNLGNDDWDRKTWKERGYRYFAKDKSKLQLEVIPNSNPWEQYQQILSQATKGDFNASEIKQLMESINVGTRVYETFKLQVEVDNMKADLDEMSQRHGNNSIAIIKAENTDKITI